MVQSHACPQRPNWRRRRWKGSRLLPGSAKKPSSLPRMPSNPNFTSSLEEVERGDLSGPFTEEQISQHFGHHEWTLNPRPFSRVIRQSCASSMTARPAASTHRSVRPTECNSWMATCYAASSGRLPRPLSIHGSPLSEAASAGPWVGGTLDLKRAYKQIAIHPSSRDAKLGPARLHC